MSGPFIGLIAALWCVPAFVSATKGEIGNFLMYTGIIVTQLGMLLNALR